MISVEPITKNPKCTLILASQYTVLWLNFDNKYQYKNSHIQTGKKNYIYKYISQQKVL